MITHPDNEYAQVDGEGRLVLPPGYVSRFGLEPGTSVRIDETDNGLNIARSPHNLAKLYIEPTSQCNLGCRTCIRNSWDEPTGRMSGETFNAIMEGLRAFSPPPVVSFGGFGEPLFHPDILDMVSRVKAAGSPVELITNGTLLTADISRKLLAMGLDTLWVSLDGATPESYSDIRLGAVLPQVIENLRTYYEAYMEDASHFCCSIKSKFSTQLGIAFVAMKRNIKDLPAVIQIGKQFGASHFLVTNVLPYTEDMVQEVLYRDTFSDNGHRHISMHRMDVNETTYEPIYQAMRSVYGAWIESGTATGKERCPFIESGVGAIGWDGNLSPCLPLLHSHTSYLSSLPEHGERFVKKWAIGNIRDLSLFELWNKPDHIAFRERIQAFDFPPCTTCGGCEMAENNEEDCFGNPFPTCGGCLWAQGIIRCP